MVPLPHKIDLLHVNGSHLLLYSYTFLPPAFLATLDGSNTVIFPETINHPLCLRTQGNPTQKNVDGYCSNGVRRTSHSLLMNPNLWQGLVIFLPQLQFNQIHSFNKNRPLQMSLNFLTKMNKKTKVLNEHWLNNLRFVTSKQSARCFRKAGNQHDSDHDVRHCCGIWQKDSLDPLRIQHTNPPWRSCRNIPGASPGHDNAIRPLGRGFRTIWSQNTGIA